MDEGCENNGRQVYIPMLDFNLILTHRNIRGVPGWFYTVSVQVLEVKMSKSPLKTVASNKLFKIQDHWYEDGLEGGSGQGGKLSQLAAHH